MAAMAGLAAITMHHPMPRYRTMDSFSYFFMSIAVKVAPRAAQPHTIPNRTQHHAGEYVRIAPKATGV